ncbi:MAG: hypothetical protein K2N18_05320, partial [Clostridia bacterium]|nr:hypothetical protein [Clostridia bacterium]
VYVQLINNPGIYAANFGIRYDNELELVEFSEGTVLAGSITSDSNKVDFGYNFVWGSGSKRTEDGNLLKLTFRVPAYAVKGREYDVFVVYDVTDGANGGFALSSRDKQCFLTRGGTITMVANLPGDVDHNNTVDVLDVLAIGRYCIGKSDHIDKTVADVNLDGEVDVLDMVVILQSLTGGYGTNVLGQEFKLLLNANGFDATLSDLLVSIYNGGNNHYNKAGLRELVRDGYKFDGWYTKLVGGEKIEVSAEVRYNPEQKAQMLYAHWTMNEIEFISNGATNDALNNLMPNVSYDSIITENGSTKYEIDSPYKREYDVAFIDPSNVFQAESGTLIYYL